MSSRNNLVDIDELLSSEEADAAYGGRQGDLQRAIIAVDATRTLALLAAPTNPNNAVGGPRSFISYALHRHMTSRVLAHDPQREQNSWAICLGLLDHGARLGHVPLDNAGTPCTLRDPDLWSRPTLGAEVMFHAMDYALTHGRTVPYLSINNIYQPDSGTSGNRTADAILAAFTNVAEVQKKVVAGLENPQTEIQERVSAKLPAENREFWVNAARSFGTPEARLNL